jgi:hypothetical protein
VSTETVNAAEPQEPPELNFTPLDDDIPPKRSWNPFKTAEKGDDKPRKEKTPAPAASQAKKLCAPLKDLYRMIGIGVSAIDQHCGFAIAREADALGESWEELARTSPGFRRFLEKAQKASGWGTVLTAHAPLALAIAAHHMPADKAEQFGMTTTESAAGRDTEFDNAE